MKLKFSVKSIKVQAILVLLFCFNIINAQHASFTSTPDSSCSPLVVNFTNTSTGATSFLWRFGNGNTSTLTNTSARYLNPGYYTVTLIAKNSSGGIDSVVKTNLLNVFKNPTANFYAFPTSRCAPLTVVFKDSSIAGSDAINSWIWDFGDGNISTIQNPSHEYLSAGKYTVKLIVTDKNGCSNNISKPDYIFLSQQPLGSFTASDSNACAPPLAINFKGNFTSKTGGTLRYSWDFGDGSTSTLANPSHTYTSLGSFTVNVSVTDSANCSQIFSKTDYININRDIAAFTYKPSSGCPPLRVKFTNTTSPLAPGSKYKWDYGDGATSTEKDSVHIYNSTGVYSVTLLVISPSGCTDSVTQSDIITVSPGPVVNFVGIDTVNCEPPATVHFYDSTTGGGIFWKWNFGDSTPNSTQPNPVHIFKKTGNYNISLTETGPNGCAVTRIKKSFIKISPPQAKIWPVPGNGCAPLRVQFYDSTKSVDPVVAWHWNFGDNSASPAGSDTSNLQNPVYIYQNPGTYSITMAVRTMGGCTDIDTFCCILVGIKPHADFVATPLTHCFSDTLPVSFTDLTNTYAVKADSFFWEFGYGGTSYLENPQDFYHTQQGAYTVTLVAFNNGCPDSMVKKDYITVDPPYSVFSFVQPKCNSDSVYFFDASLGATSIKWSFGDGDTSTALNPVHLYADTGVYLVRHWAYNSVYGCKDSITKKVSIHQPPADFYATDTLGCVPLSTQFFSKNTTAGNKYLWDFGNGDTSVKVNPVEIYNEPGAYTVTLKIISADSCVLETIKRHYINISGPYSNFNINPITGCLPLSTTFIDSSTSPKPIVKETLSLGDGRVLNINTKTQNIVFNDVPANQNTGFPVTLKVQDNNGCIASKTIFVQPSMPKPSFKPTLASDCQSKIFTFTTANVDSMGLAPFTYLWNFGNGNTSNIANPTTVYSAAGVYIVSLALTDANGCMDSVSKILNVVDKLPAAGFKASRTFANCPPLIDSFTDTSIARAGAIIDWYWNFGDGTSSNLQNPEKIYSTVGSFNVSLKIVDSFGCSDSVIYYKYISIVGPSGSFSDSPKLGCSPLTVHFKAKSLNANKFEWDLGDGSPTQYGDTLTHAYYNDAANVKLLPIAHFKPSLTIEDTIGGCSYSILSKDSIAVYAPPQPAESHGPSCYGYPTHFIDSSQALVGRIVKWYWSFGDGSADSTHQNPYHTYQNPGIYNFALTVTSNFGCENTINQSIKIGGIKAAFIYLDSSACVGRPFHFQDKSLSDTPITGWLWLFGDGDSSRVQNPAHTFLTKGVYSVKLFVMDARGCFDTVRNYPPLMVGDTAPPPTPPIYRVTVNNDNTVQIDFAKANPFDFKEYIIYRETGAGFVKVANTYNINDTSVLDNGVNNLLSSFCYKLQLINVCGYASALDSSQTHCTIFLGAKGDTNSVNLNWSRYVGWDAVKRYIIYRMNAKDSFVMIGSVDGNTNTFTDSSAYCIAQYTYKVEGIKNGPDSQIVSFSDTAVASPIYPAYIPPNQIVTASDSNDKIIWVEWSDQPKVKIKGFLLYQSSDGVTYYQLGNLFGKDTFSTFDTAVQVKNQSYYYQVKIEDICGDISGYSNLGKTILLTTDTNQDLLPFLHWSAYSNWPEGVQSYTIQIRDEKGNWNYLANVDGNTFDFVDDITDLNSMPSYCYRIIAHRNEPFSSVFSESNVSCVKVRTTVFVPNAFTPNNDGVNDFFVIKGLYISSIDLKIYNRWGQFLFESHSLKDQWNGTYDGRPCQMDAYLWTLTVIGVDNTSHFLSGTVTIVK